MSVGVLVPAALAVVAFVYYQRNMATRHIFVVNYNLIYEKTGSVSEALRQAIEVFRYRRPFETLSDDDVEHFVAVFSQHSDPMVVADLFHNVDRRQDGSALKDRDWVIKVAIATEKNKQCDV